MNWFTGAPRTKIGRRLAEQAARNVPGDIDLWPAMQKFLMQPIEQRVSQAEAVNALRQLFAAPPPPPKAS